MSTIVYAAQTKFDICKKTIRNIKGLMESDDIICLSQPSSTGGTVIYNCDKKGRLQGSFIHYSPFGYKIMECTLNNGLLDGQYKQYYCDGSIMHCLTFRDGRRHGLQMKFYPGGRLYNVSDYSFGLRDGWYSVYCPSGQLIMRKKYTMGHFFE